MFSRINKRNFILSSRRDNEAVVSPRRGGVPTKSRGSAIPLGIGTTQNLNKISLLQENPDFAQYLRYVSLKYIHTFSSTSLGLGQNQDFNLSKKLSYKYFND